MFKSCRYLLPLLLCLVFTACAGFGDDNAPPPAVLTSYPFEFQPVRLWSVTTGGGVGKDFLRLGPVIKEGQIFVANKSGSLVSVALQNGHKQWKVQLHHRLSSAPAVDQGVVVLASMRPELLAFATRSGALLWRVPLPNQVLASPAIRQGRVVVKTVDGSVLAFSAGTGQLLWRYHHGAPTLVLSSSSAPQIIGDKVLIGFSDGTLSALRLSDGEFLWERTIAVSKGTTEAEQLVGIAADLLLSRQTVYVVTYQGELAAIELQTGRTQWRRPFSSYLGLVLGESLFVSDSDGGLWAFSPLTGQLLWKTKRLHHRGVTAPAVIGNQVVLGDQEGYLHWFAQADGRPLARVCVRRHANASIVATPRVALGLVCVLTRQGGLSAWTQKNTSS